MGASRSMRPASASASAAVAVAILDMENHKYPVSGWAGVRVARSAYPNPPA